jgi:hypothetical protein
MNKWKTLIIIAVIGATLFGIYQLLIHLYVLFPWAVPWVGNIIYPTPPKPNVKHTEINFTLTYEIGEEAKTLNDTIICQFDGFAIDAGRGKTRKWKYHFKNKQNNEVFVFDTKNPSFPKIVLENIDRYKIVLGVASAEYFLAEPDYKGAPELPSIQVYDTEIGYYKDPTQSKEFLDEYSFRVISWYCDPPITNTFK